MSAARRHKKHHHEEHENHERWLVSGYDMMTLLFAVFVVLFAISSTNISKVKLLEQSLQEAFSGPVLTGGRAMMKTGDDLGRPDSAAPEKPLPSLTPAQALAQAMSPQDAERGGRAGPGRGAQLPGPQEAHRQAGQGGRPGREDVTTVTPDGLKIRLITDGVLFDSGSAMVKSGGRPTLERDRPHHRPGGVASRPGRGPHRRSSDRHFAVPVQLAAVGRPRGGRRAALNGAGVSGKRMSLAGYAAEHPVAGNATPAGRAKNRRVEIILTRLHGAIQSQGGDK